MIPYTNQQCTKEEWILANEAAAIGVSIVHTDDFSPSYIWTVTTDITLKDTYTISFGQFPTKIACKKFCKTNNFRIIHEGKMHRK